MKTLLDTYSRKLEERGLARREDIFFAALEADVTWNRPDPERELEKIFSGMSVTTLLSARPAEPYRTMLNSLVHSQPHPLQARDTETRTFLHDIPVAPAADADTLLPFLRRRKGVIAPGPRLVTTGTVTPEQAFIAFSSMIHACFVLYCLDYLDRRRATAVSLQEEREFESFMEQLPPPPTLGSPLIEGPFADERAVIAAVAEAGKRTVAAGLVDSYFGNVSCRHNDRIYISQTGSSLEALENAIDACPMDLSSCTGITASSELPA
ncbi:MAG: rRNA adenine dimethylase, partial [Candidatus Aminicenantes bacterium]|nr:rRNA adenine dimethylase [Candidatus Aminicenantes bacterium]